MDKKELILVGAGFLFAYLLFKRISLNNSTALNSDIKKSSIDSGSTQVKEPEIIENPIFELCKNKWIKFSETQRFPSQEKMQATYDNFMTICTAQN